MILPDVLRADLRVVFCGTAAGAASAQVGAYYAGPGNAFWRTLHEIGLTPLQLEPAQFREVTRYGIGLTDIAKQTSGADSTLKPTDFDAEALREKILTYAPRVLAFNGKRAAQAFYGHKSLMYGRQPKPLNTTRVVVLPSTSGAARRFWDERHWHDLVDWLALSN